MKVLITGGAGYIGSTICSALKDNGHKPIILDSLINGKREFTKDYIFYEGDIADRALLEKVFTDHPDIRCTIHCAALIVVPESVENPYGYYTENVAKSLELFHNLNSLGYNDIIFSSSGSIYDDVDNFMVTEESPLNPRSPYARTKFMMEMILKDFCASYGMRGIALRYFNPIGADPKMRSGPYDKFPTHVVAKLIEAASGDSGIFKITGVHWDTRDGSSIKDYLHVWDLAMAHVKAVEKFDRIFSNEENVDSNYVVINLGSGNGVTVKELVTAFEKIFKVELNKVETEPRLGDVAGAYANANKALKLLGWKTELSVENGMSDALKWGQVRESILGY